ncbi:putative RNA recognition motif domain, nucleotide-binding alpha-beta plait domain superfamily [Helianthus anomalus]
MEVEEQLTREKTRIYVGGLGAGVTEDDLRKTFSALGEVVSVDVVRTKGRSFAYLDFLPSSDKSLPKLFSTYNGCMWKGGKLRLEKAKEHYLVKLKREWQEESEHASKASDKCNPDATKIHDTSEKPKKPSPADKTQIHIFFPKLGKVKSLAQVGIGKHKYSFQRIQVPPVPTHFCDCEEHSLAFPPPSKKQSMEIDDASYGINEQELSIMNSVMNKIFERANPSKQVIELSESTNEEDEPVTAETDEEDQLTDDDDMIINVGNRKNDGMDLLGEMKAMMANTSTEKPNKVKDNSRKKSDPLDKKRKSSHTEGTSGNSRARVDTQENDKKEVGVVRKQSENSRARVDTQENDKKVVGVVRKQSENNSLRSLKSSWKGLIGQKRDTSFSISDFIASRKEEELNLDKKRKLEADENRPGTEVGDVATENNIPDIIANNYEQKEEQPKADNLDQKEEEPKSDDVDQKEEEPQSDEVDQKEEEPKSDDLDQKEEELETDDLDCNFDNRENDQDLKKPTKDSPVKNDEDLIRTARGEFWRHKSSWTQLISTASHSSFSISQIVPDVSFGKHEQQADTFDSQPANKNHDDQMIQIPIVTKEATLSPAKNKVPERKRIKLSLGKLESDETCPFMRTEESMKKWKNLKAASSGSLNKKKRLVNESA